MGFWHTGYFEFKDPLDLDGAYKPGPTIYRCQQCEATFNTAGAADAPFRASYPLPTNPLSRRP